MDWTLIRSLLDANLDQVLAKATDPAATLTALSRKISAASEMVEAHLASMSQREQELPGLIGQEEAALAKVDAVIAKAKQEGRADLLAAATARHAKNQETLSALAAELSQLEGERTRAEDALAKLEDRKADVESRGETGVSNDDFDFAALDGGPKAAPAPVAKPAPVVAPAKPAATPAASSAPAKKAAGGSLDDEFASLMSDLNVNLDEVELPKKKGLPAKVADDDLGIPDLVDVKDNELPEGEEDDLPPLKGEKYNIPKGPAKGAAPPAKGGAAAAAKGGAVAAAKGGSVAVAKPGTPAKMGDAPKSGSKRWLWISGAVVTLGGAGAAVAHFALHLF